MEKTKRIQLFEVILYAAILLTILGIPFLTETLSKRGWHAVWIEWARIVPFIIVFIVNNFILVPKLLFNERYTKYLLACLALILVVIVLPDMLFDWHKLLGPPFDGMRFEGKELMNDGFSNMHRGEGPPHTMRPGPRNIIHIHFGDIIISLLLIGFNTGIKFFVRYTKNQVYQAEKEKQHLSTELTFLRYQVSPHFFMNTLNNIHALIDIDGERAKDAIVRLSQMMRYLLYESDPDVVSLKKEIEFMESYIELMRLRYDEENLEIEFTYPLDIEHVFVPAFIFLSFIENAFKHGILAEGKSYIRLSFRLTEENRLQFEMENSIGNQRSPIQEVSGIGIDNIHKRLDILYKNDYLLEIHDTDVFNVKLNIPPK